MFVEGIFHDTAIEIDLYAEKKSLSVSHPNISATP